MSLSSALRPRFCTIATSCLLMAVPAEAIAQLEFSGQLGSFLPTTDLFRLDSGMGSGSGSETYRQQVAPAIGGRVAYRLSQRMALEAAVLHAPSDLAEKEEPLISGSDSERVLEASILAVTLRTRIDLGPAQGRVRPHLLAGGGVIRRGGSAWRDHPLGRSLGVETSGTTDPALVLGGGVDIRLTSRLAVRLGLEDYLSFASFTVTRQATPTGGTAISESSSRLQNEIVLSQSLVLALGEP